MSIRILPDDVVSQIAAGEVVERPASVVKELIENALDAHAKQVTVRIDKGGRGLIEVADDGDGISAVDLPLAMQRHATSKLRFADDLFNIHTLGFRGEALASIGSVSRLTIISRSKDETVGGRLLVEGGRVGAVEKTGVPAGTVVHVEDLFYNVPARLKFLKQETTERRRIDALVSRYALAYPGVRWQLLQDAQQVLQTSGNGDGREALAALYGVEVARQMLEVVMEETDHKLSGFVSPVALTRSNRQEITFFINGRWVQDTTLVAALTQAYHTLLMVGRYPMAVLFLHINPEEIDVNVHPAKAEVRFRNQEKVFSIVQRGVRRALLAYSPTPALRPAGWQTAPAQRQIDPVWGMAADLKSESENPSHADLFLQTQATLQTSLPSSAIPSGQLPLLRLIGQVGNAYLVAEGPDGLYLIDQHAAHERVLYERFRQQRQARIPTQVLLEPALIQLTPQSAQLLGEQLGLLSGLGFDIEPFGPNTFRVRGIPAILTGSDPAAALRVVVEDFEEDETPLEAAIESRLMARICKRAAIKAGQTMTAEEQKGLLRDLETCQSPCTCPHGRPTMIHLSVDLLERQFGRRGSR